MSPLLQEEEACDDGQRHSSGSVSSEKPNSTRNGSTGKADADGTLSDPEFSEFESYQVCLVSHLKSHVSHLAML
jgi:hypothetical protein